MLQQIFHISIVSGICCIWGLPLVLAAKKDQLACWTGRSRMGFFSFLCLAGCITLSFLSSWSYLLLPLRFSYLLAITALLLLILILFYRKKIRSVLPDRPKEGAAFPPAVSLFLFLGLFLFVTLSCLSPANRDTQIYHTQTIRWISLYNAVPGMANLFLRLGLGSNWFGLISLFYIPYFKQENFSYMNASLTIWFFTWLLSNWKYHFALLQVTAGHRFLCLFYFLILTYCLFDWELFRDAANSTNYDLIVTACLIIAISFLLEGMAGMQEQRDFSIIFVLITISAVGFKFSGIFGFLLIMYYLILNRSLSNFLTIALITFLIITPVLLRNYIITGYLLYPLSFSIGAPDWQVPKAMTDLLHNYIILSNRFYSNTFINTYEFKDKNPAWSIGWFRTILWQHRLLIVLILSSTTLLFVKTAPALDQKRLRLLVITLLLMTAGWFLTAPSPRFGYGVLLCAAFIPVSLAACGKIKQRWYTYSLLAASLFIVVYLPGKAAVLIRDPGCWLHPIALPTLAYRTIPVKGVNLHLPENLYCTDDIIKCNDTPLPCICEENPYLQPRGTSLQNGFRMTPKPDSAFIQNYKY